MWPTSTSLRGESVEVDVLEVPVQLVAGHQVARGADRVDLPVVEQDDLIASPEGRQAVRQEDQGAGFRHPVDRVVDQRLDRRRRSG